jgi:hypothetical protein
MSLRPPAGSSPIPWLVVDLPLFEPIMIALQFSASLRDAQDTIMSL